MRLIRRWRRAEEGVAAIEGAIVLFGFIFLIFTMMEFLYVLFAYNTVVRAAENAARFAMVNSAHNCAWLQANVNNSVAHVGVIPVSISVIPAGCAAGTPTKCLATGAPALPGTIVIHAEYDFNAAGFFLTYLESVVPIQATVCVPLIP